MPSVEIIDISKGILKTDAYPGDPVPSFRFVKRSDTDGYNLGLLSTGVHSGTHVDAPLHFFDDGISVDELDLNAFVGPCTVVETPPGLLTGADVDRLFPRVCERVLLRGNGKTLLHQSAASEIAYRGCRLLGIDAATIEAADAKGASHRFLLGENVAILENLNLSEVREGDYFLLSQPVIIEGAEAAPCRALLIKGHIFWSGSR
jgi:arylformamidase